MVWIQTLYDFSDFIYCLLFLLVDYPPLSNFLALFTWMKHHTQSVGFGFLRSYWRDSWKISYFPSDKPCTIRNKRWEKIRQITSPFFLSSIHYSEVWFLCKICLMKSHVPGTYVNWESCCLSLQCSRFTLTYLSLVPFPFASFLLA